MANKLKKVAQKKGSDHPISVKTAYIGGKITGLKDLNKPLFAIAESELRLMGYGIVYNPHKICKGLPVKSPWETYMKVCLSKMLNSDDVFFLNDWWMSRGARMEIRIAKKMGIPVYKAEQQMVKYKTITGAEYYFKYLLGILFF